MIICVENSLGWQNALIDEASVQFRLTTKKGVPIRARPFCRLEMLIEFVKKLWYVLIAGL